MQKWHDRMPLRGFLKLIFWIYSIAVIAFFADNFAKEYFLLASLSQNSNLVFEEKKEDVKQPAEEPVFNFLPKPEQSRQNILDDIQEKLDIIQQQVNELVQQTKEPEKLTEPEKIEIEMQEAQEIEQEQDIIQQKPIAIKHANSTPEIIYPKILINEVRILPINQRFIKLYNPNSAEVSLTGWYLQRKTKTANSYSSCVSSTRFLGQIIGSNDYFLIEGDLTLTEGNSLVLKSPNGQISDSFEISTKAENILENILINEVQILPISERFVELYNPNGFAVNLTGFYIQRKTQSASSWSSFVSSSNFEGQIIGSNDYFLVSREVELSDIKLNITLSDNNYLVLKDASRDIVDSFEWQALPEKKSFGRDKDNNFVIFDTPTPKNKNY